MTFDPHECSLWSRVLLTKVGSHSTFQSNLTSGWPLHDLWPHGRITYWVGMQEPQPCTTSWQKEVGTSTHLLHDTSHTSTVVRRSWGWYITRWVATLAEDQCVWRNLAITCSAAEGWWCKSKKDSSLLRILSHIGKESIFSCPKEQSCPSFNILNFWK